MYLFLPRVNYKNLIFSPAIWIIKKDEISEVIKIKEDKKLWAEIQKFREEKNIPPFILLADGDNELLLNLENLLCIKTLISMIKNRMSFKITEFVCDEKNGIAKDRNGFFTNEFIISFYKTKTE
jgi:hypothetical protein